jgi:hypothetical protein
LERRIFVMSNQPDKATALANVQALIAGTQKHDPNGQLTFGNATYTTASLVEVLQGLAAAYPAESAARASAKEALAALNAKKATVDPVIRAYVTYLRATYSNATAVLSDYGLQAPKARTPMSAQTRIAATEKARATRVARGTVGKKRKLAIKGDVTGVIVTPITTSAPAPSASPAVSTPASPAGATAPASPTTAPAVVAK